MRHPKTLNTRLRADVRQAGPAWVLEGSGRASDVATTTPARESPAYSWYHLCDHGSTSPVTQVSTLGH